MRHTRDGATPLGVAEPLAIVGIGCRFPGGASSSAAFWRLLSDGVDAITEIPGDRWDAATYYSRDPSVAGRIASARGGFIPDVDRFDALFFGISPREASRMDPQQRVLLEVAWEALEDAGQVVDRLAGRPIGVFIGISGHDYNDIQIGWSNRESIDAHTGTGGAMSLAANRISYVF